jgi:serine/threonine protein kinase
MKKIFEGKTLKGRFKILEEIGTGGYGSVFKAMDLKCNCEVAVKIVIQTFFKNDGCQL